jgi:hypothetical protein
MSNLYKRLSKLVPNRTNTLTLGLSADEVELISTLFSNVFVLSENKVFKSKNVIYIEEKSKTFLLPDITAIITNLETLNTVFDLSSIISRYHPSIVILNCSVEDIQKNQNKSFLSMNYDIYYKQKNTQLWKLRTDQ